MRIIYMGTPEFAAIALSAIVKEHEVVAVVTQPDKPQGRNRKLVIQAGCNRGGCVWTDSAGEHFIDSAVWLYQHSCVTASEIPWRSTN